MFPIEFLTETTCIPIERSRRAIACPQAHCSQAVLLKTGPGWWSAQVSFQAGLCGQLHSLRSKLFASGSDFLYGKDPFDTDQVQLWSLYLSLLPCEFSPKQGNWANACQLRREAQGRWQCPLSCMKIPTLGPKSKAKRDTLNRSQMLLPFLSLSPLPCR